VKAFSKFDTKVKGTVTAGDFERVLQKLCGGSFGNQGDFRTLEREFDVVGNRKIDYYLFAMWICAGSDPAALLNKTKRLLRMCELRIAGAKADLAKGADSNGKTSVDEFVTALQNVGVSLPMIELQALARQYQLPGSEQVWLAKFLADVHNPESVSRKAKSNVKEDINIGKNLFVKLCELRSDIRKVHWVRNRLLSIDSGKDGNISSERMFIELASAECVLTHDEQQVVLDNFATVGGDCSKSLSYAHILLLLKEPFSSYPTKEAAILIKRLSRVRHTQDPAQVLASILSSVDQDFSGMVTVQQMLQELAHLGITTCEEEIASIIELFLHKNRVGYPELCEFLKASNIQAVQAHFKRIYLLRKRQGYNMVVATEKLTFLRKRKITLQAFEDILQSMGFLMSFTSINTLFQKHQVDRSVDISDLVASLDGTPEGNAHSLSLHFKKLDVDLNETMNERTDGYSESKEAAQPNYATEQKLESNKSTLKSVSGNKVDEKIREALACVFDYFDADNSNTINASELEQALVALGQVPTKEDVRRLLLSMDEDGSGVLEFREFRKALTPVLQEAMRKPVLIVSDEQLQLAFRRIDVDQKGWLSRSEFVHVMINVYMNLSRDEAFVLATFLDSNNDGHIVYTEFSRVRELFDGSVTSDDIPLQVQRVLDKVSDSCTLDIFVCV
jgi:calmodulin